MAMGEKAIQDVLDDYMESANDNADILWAYNDDRVGRKAWNLFTGMRSEALKMLDKARKADGGRVRRLTGDGNKLIAMMDRELPEMHRLAWARVRNAPPELAELQKALRRMEKAIPANKRVMNDAAKELVADVAKNTGGVVLKVNGEEITSSGEVIKVACKAKSAKDEPCVEILLRGPEGVQAKIEYSETEASKALNWNEKWMNKRVIKIGTDKDKVPRGELTELVQGGSKIKARGSLEANLPGWNYELKVEFKTRGLSAAYAFKVVVGDRSPLLFDLEITFTAHRFIKIDYKGTNYTGYGREEACWGLPELKTFIDKFAALHLKEAKKKPYIGNKAVRDGVKYYPHDGKSHAKGYAVDIDFGVDTGNAKVGKTGYDEKAHREQIKRYLACGAKYVIIGSEKIAKELTGKNGITVKYDGEGHSDHDHINVK